MQHDSPVGLAAGEGPVGVLHGCERVGCGDGDVKIAGSGEVSQLGQRGKPAGIGRPERFDALVLRAAVVDDGVDPLSRHVQCECETAADRLRVSEQRATSLLQAAAIGAIHTLLATPPEDRDTGLAESMCDAVLGQIITDPPAPAPADGDTIATAVTLRSMAPRLDALTPAERQMLGEWLDRVIDHDAKDRSGAAATLQ